MSEQPAAVAETAPPAPVDPPEPESGTDLSAEVAKWKEMARKNEARAKENAEAARRLAEIEDRDKTEQQRLAERAERAEAELADTRSRLMRQDIAARKGLPMELAGRLQGSTAEELESDADALLSLMAAQARPVVPPPVDLGQGQRGPGKATQLTRADLSSMGPEQIVQAKAEGRLDDLLGITTK